MSSSGLLGVVTSVMPTIEDVIGVGAKIVIAGMDARQGVEVPALHGPGRGQPRVGAIGGQGALQEGLQRLELAGVGAASAAVCASAMLRLPVSTAVIMPALALTTLSYPRLKRQPVTKLLLLPLTWVWGAAALPFNDGSWAGWHLLLQPVVVPLLLLVAWAARALLGTGTTPPGPAAPPPAPAGRRPAPRTAGPRPKARTSPA